MRSFRNVALVLLVLPFVAGCPLLRWLGFPVGDRVPYNPKADSGDVAVRKDIQFEDIPVPIGFVLRRDQVFSFRGHSFRFGRFVYEGAWTMRKTTDFYREQMPISGWQLLKTDEKDFYEQTQVYTKRKEVCSVHIKSRTDGVYVLVRLNDSDSAPDAKTP